MWCEQIQANVYKSQIQSNTFWLNKLQRGTAFSHNWTELGVNQWPKGERLLAPKLQALISNSLVKSIPWHRYIDSPYGCPNSLTFVLSIMYGRIFNAACLWKKLSPLSAAALGYGMSRAFRVGWWNVWILSGTQSATQNALGRGGRALQWGMTEQHFIALELWEHAAFYPWCWGWAALMKQWLSPKSVRGNGMERVLAGACKKGLSLTQRGWRNLRWKMIIWLKGKLKKKKQLIKYAPRAFQNKWQFRSV